MFRVTSFAETNKWDSMRCKPTVYVTAAMDTVHMKSILILTN